MRADETPSAGSDPAPEAATAPLSRERQKPRFLPRPERGAPPNSAASAVGDFPPIYQMTRTFLNCHGSLLSMSSGNRRSRSVSGVQSVYAPSTSPQYGWLISILRRKSISSGSTRPQFGFSMAHTMPARHAEVTCRLVALLYGARARASSMVSCEPYQ